MITDTTPHYAAFISYAHADEAVAARLHKALETYPVPKHLRGEGRTTRPIFRDVAELTAAHSLSEKIRDAVNNSRVLIVLCSPAAKASHWVNEEIKLFREIHGEGAILSALIEGTPATSFPEALVQGGREPLAASLGASNAGFRLGVTQLAAGILGTGLDELVQRGAKRRTRRMGMGLGASLAFSAVMGFTAYQAIDARNEAELERGESEALLQFMVKDLKVNLEPVGRLDLLEGTGRKAVQYYSKKSIDTLSDDNLTTFAAARQVVANVALKAGRIEEAQSQIEASSDLTREVLARNPDDANAIYAHAQSEYWVGQYYKLQGKISESEKPWREYDRLVQLLYQKDSNNFDWIMENAWAQNNLGAWAKESLDPRLVDEAKQYYNRAIELFKEAGNLKPQSGVVLRELANCLAGRAFVELSAGTAMSARGFKKEQLAIERKLEEKHPENVLIQVEKVKSLMDYYNKFYLVYSEKQRKEIRETLNEFFDLAKYDRDNLANMEYFLNAATSSFELFNATELQDRKTQITEILSLYKKSKESNKGDILYYSELLSLLKVRINYLEGERKLALDTLDAVDLNALDDLISESQRSKLLNNILLRRRELSEVDTSKMVAQKFLDSTETLTSGLRLPTILEMKITAFLELGQCEKIHPLANDLVIRGFQTETWKNSLSCSL